MIFIDEAKIYVKAGDGGNGCIAFRREAHVPLGGPSGGDGGNGGDVVFVADPQLSTLLDFKYQQHYRADSGEDGRNRDQYGKFGEPLIVHVPVGTIVKNHETGEPIVDLAVEGQRAVVCKGGTGGRGNIHFKTATNQAPRIAEPGTPGDERTLRLELKLLAEAGLLGFPNVGKSTFLSVVSRARPKIANYPFTTLTPNLGVVGLSDNRSFVLADIPGLIEGAAEGAGLGHRFLRHVERTKVLLHLLELTVEEGREPEKDFDTINAELAKYDEVLSKRPQIVALTKADLPDTQAAFPDLKERFAQRGIDLHLVSAVTGAGVKVLLELLFKAIRL